MKSLMISFSLLIFSTHLIAQIAINNNGSAADPSAILDVYSTSKGLLLPRMTAIQRDNISNPAEGLMIFNTTTNKFQGFLLETDTVVDQQQTDVLFAQVPVYRLGQSFTTGQSGYITAIEFGYNYCYAGYTFQIYWGAGCDPAKLFRQQGMGCTPIINLNSPLTVSAEQVYTFFIIPTDDVDIRYTQDSPYTRGVMYDECDPVSTLDLYFKVYVEIQVPSWVNLNE